jgi:hypothetical protein
LLPSFYDFTLTPILHDALGKVKVGGRWRASGSAMSYREGSKMRQAVNDSEILAWHAAMATDRVTHMPVVEGTISFGLIHQDADWPTNNCSYVFGPVDHQGTKATVIKDADGTIRAALEICQGATVTRETTLPPPPKSNRYATFFRWDANEAICSISGKRLPAKPSAKA